MGCGCQSKKIKTYLRASNRKSSDFANRKPSRSRGQTNQGIDQGDNGARGAASNQLTRFAHAVLMAFVRLGQIADIFRPSGPADLAMPEKSAPKSRKFLLDQYRAATGALPQS